MTAWRILNDANNLSDALLRPSAGFLESFCELGFLSFASREILPPKCNFCVSARMNPFLQYITEYLNFHSTSNLTAYFTLYDGWREHTPPILDPTFAILSLHDLQRGFLNVGSQNEPGRFISRGDDRFKSIFPVFKYPVISFSRHFNDPTVILIPDSEFLSTQGFVDLKRSIDDDDIPWETKHNTVIWRGGNHGIGYDTYSARFDIKSKRGKLLNQREAFIHITANNSMVSAHFVNQNDLASVSRKHMLNYKYQVDIDGEVNAWSGLWWKLYSNSVVFKVASHFQQWYYKLLQPWVHYIPLNANLTDFDEKLEWAVKNDDTCKQIAQNGKVFIEQLTYDYAVRDFNIQNDFDIILKGLQM